jgi:hypothetical protein
VAAVALARVTREDPAFLGVAEEAGLLPGVAALDEQRRRLRQRRLSGLGRRCARCGPSASAKSRAR